MKNKKIILKDREQLEQGLKELAETEFKSDYNGYSAMCYSSMGIYYKDYICPTCKMKVKFSSYILGLIKYAREIVDEIKKIGYDAFLDETEFCGKCSGKEFSTMEYVRTRRELIFKIRFSPDSEYHVARTNVGHDFFCVLEFLNENKTFFQKHDDMLLSNKWYTAILQKMLGLGKDIQIPK
jgi:hypothetical protein